MDNTGHNMTQAPLQFTMDNGELVGDGCSRDMAYLRARVLHATRRYKTGEESERRAALVADMTTSWWRWRNGTTVGYVCRAARDFCLLGDLSNT